MRILAFATVVVLASSGATLAAETAKKAPKKSKAPIAEAKKAAPVLPAEKLDKVRGILFGDDDVAAADAAKALGQSGASNAIEPLLELLSVGAAPARSQAALEALGALGDPAAIDELEVYAGHHSPDVRRRAVRALGVIKDDKAVPPLLGALGDAAPDVRAAAADALAARKESKAAPRLLALVKRNDAGAAPALGLLATPDLVPQLAELQGSVDDNVVASALGEYVKRDDVPDPLRVDVVRTIGRLSGAAATTALVEYLASVPAKDDRPSKKEAQKLVDEKGERQVTSRGRWLAVACLATAVGCATSPYKRAGSSDDVASALSGRTRDAARPANAQGRPLAFLALAGVKGPRLAAYDLSTSRILWTQPAELRARVEVGSDFIVYGVADALVARDLLTGAERWRHAISKDERLLGYTADEGAVFVVLQKGGAHLHSGAGSLIALDGRTGSTRWTQTLASGNAGAPAARGGLVAVPLQSQYVALLDARSGEPLAQVLSSEEAATFVRALPEGFFFGSRGVFRLSPVTASGSRKSGGYVQAKLPAFVRPVYWFDLYRPEQGDYSALDRNRILWRMAPAAEARFRDDMAFVHNYRFFFGFDARSGALKWAYNHPSTEAVSSADVGDALVFVTADGELGALDTHTGRRVFQAKLPGEVVRGATFDADGWAPPHPVPEADTPALSETLSTIVWDPDRRFWDVKMFAIEELARQPGRNVTEQLLKITAQEGLPPAVYQKAGEALIARKDGVSDATSGEMLAHALDVHADYAENRSAPAVEILARAAGAMKAKAAAPALIVHLRRPETPPAAATQIARALAQIGATEALPALRDFVTMYRADPLYDGDPTPLVAASEAMLALGGPAERQLLLYLAEEPRTVEPLRAHLRRALAQTAAASMAAAPAAAE